MTNSALCPKTIDELEDALSTPSAELVEMMKRLPGDLMFLGVGGKMGPTMARMARRATDAAKVPRRILGVSRFSTPGTAEQLQAHGIETRSCDLLDEDAIARLPDAPLIVSMTGFKFGSQSNPAMTWAMNCYVPTMLAKRFQNSRILSFSSGNIYPLVPVGSGGSVESDRTGPVGEYAMTVLGRERLYEYFSQSRSIPMALLRLNYSTELRYGVLVDLALAVWNREVIDLSMGYVNVIWQTEANDMSLRMMEHASTPAKVINIAGSEILQVRTVCEQFGQLLDREPHFEGTEAPDALLNNASQSHRLLGPPKVSADQMIRWTAEWIRSEGPRLNKPTHFNTRSGRF